MRRSILSILILASLLTASTVTKTIAIAPEDLSYQKLDGFDLITLKGAHTLREPGMPNLPQIPCHFLIPASAEVEKVEIINQEVIEIDGTFRIFPAQRCFPLSKPEEIKWTAPSQEIYASAEPYPEEIIEYVKSGSAHGFRIVVVNFNPLQYFPKAGKILLNKSVTIRLQYKEGKHQSIILSQRQFDAFLPEIRHLVVNPEDIDQYAPQVRPNAIGDVNYAIVTNTTLENEFDAFKLWKTKKGYNCDVFTTTWIYSNYSGYDNPEKIRNFLKDYYQNEGLIYVLLAGDYHITPERDAYSSYYSPYYNASDWYYGDMDGTWDQNNNHRYGERSGDNVDGFFDIYPGRAPVDNATHCATFTHKATCIDKNPPTDHIKKMLLPSVQLFSWWHGREVNNAIASITPAGWFDAKLEDPSRYATRDSLAQGYQLCHVAAHGNDQGFYTQSGSPILLVGDISSMNNGDELTTLYSIACYPGNFDAGDCFAEHFVNKDGGAGCAAILNSRYGFGSYSGFGPSEWLCIKFTEGFFYQGFFTIAQALAWAKEYYDSYIWNPGQGVWHYCGIEWNLFGDPNMPMYENTPIALNASYPDPIQTGSQNFTVTVTDSKAPVEDALVCTYKDGEVHETGYTNSSGQVTISINPQTPGTMYVTATAKDHFAFEGTCTVQSPGVEESPVIPNRTRITSISNNPGNRFLIGYSIAAPTNVVVALFDINGRLVKNVVNDSKEAGYYTLRIDDEKLRAGIYFLRFNAGDYQQTEKLILVK